MSQKSERKKAIKAQKQAGAAALPPPPRKWYAEDAAEFVEDHRTHCTDPTCEHRAIGINPPRPRKMVAVVYPQKLNEIFFGVYGTGKDEDYRPFMSLQLANPEDIRALFNSNGVPTGFSYGEESGAKPMCLAFTCHNEGAVIAIEPNLPGVVTIRCKTCNNWLRSKGLAEQFQLATRPKVGWPNILCPHHGIEPRYVVCHHVLEGGKYPTWLLPPDAQLCGEAFCEDCGKLREEEGDAPFHRDLWVFKCQSGLNDHFHGRLKEMLEAVGESLYVLPETVLNTPSSSAVN